jgi:hypothetical protein
MAMKCKYSVYVNAYNIKTEERVLRPFESSICNMVIRLSNIIATKKLEQKTVPASTYIAETSKIKVSFLKEPTSSRTSDNS